MTLLDSLIIQDPFAFSLSVLARDPATFNQFYNTSVSHILDVLGFNKDYNRPNVCKLSRACSAHAHDRRSTRAASASTCRRRSKHSRSPLCNANLPVT